MKCKYTLENINRAIDLIAANGVNRSYTKVNQNLRTFRNGLARRRAMLHELDKLSTDIDKSIPGLCALNTSEIRGAIERDLTRYERDSAGWVRSLKVTHGMIGNFQACFIHMMICDANRQEDNPLYMAGLESADWYVPEHTRIKLMNAFNEDSNGKVLEPFMNYADNFLERHPVLNIDKHKLDRHIPVHAMVYTGRFHRHYPIVLILRCVVDFYGQLKVIDGDNRAWLPKKWIPMLVKMPSKYILHSNQTNGETP